MKVLKNTEELRKEMLKNKEKYVGMILVDRFGRKWVIDRIDEEGILCHPYIDVAG